MDHSSWVDIQSGASLGLTFQPKEGKQKYVYHVQVLTPWHPSTKKELNKMACPLSKLFNGNPIY